MLLLKKEFSGFKHNKIIGCIAGFVLPKETQKRAMDAGLYVLTQAGQTIKILNNRNFTPKEF